jgi:hypothetical protein
MSSGPMASRTLTEAGSVSTRHAPARPPAERRSPRRYPTRLAPARLGGGPPQARPRPRRARCPPAPAPGVRAARPRRSPGARDGRPGLQRAQPQPPTSGKLPLRQLARFKLLGDAQPLRFSALFCIRRGDDLSRSSPQGPAALVRRTDTHGLKLARVQAGMIANVLMPRSARAFDGPRSRNCRAAELVKSTSPAIHLSDLTGGTDRAVEVEPLN